MIQNKKITIKKINTKFERLKKYNRDEIEKTPILYTI